MAGHFTNIKCEIIKKCFYITINIFVWLVLNTTADEEFYGCEEIDDCQTEHETSLFLYFSKYIKSYIKIQWKRN